MGLHLSHLNNSRSDPATGRFPDENYAREVMQLFSIGLYELAADGSRRLDAEGRLIPTYGNREITEFAKIFTGLGPGGPEGEFGSDEVDLTRAMRMYEPFHEPGPKRLLNGTVVPGGQSGMEDVAAAVDNLFRHPNVGPFLGRLLIQRLVTSNPSPGYVARVATAFADNGDGERGDLAAVVSAILLDPEARRTALAAGEHFGHLQEPVLRATGLLRAFRASTGSGFFPVAGWRLQENLLQHPLSAPSVFSFFLPDHQPKSELSDRGLVEPEFQITTSATTVNQANLLDENLRHGELAEIPELGLLCFELPEECEDLFLCEDEECFEELAEELLEDHGDEIFDEYGVELDLEEELELAEDDPRALLDRIDLLLTHGGCRPRPAASSTRRSHPSKTPRSGSSSPSTWPCCPPTTPSLIDWRAQNDRPPHHDSDHRAAQPPPLPARPGLRHPRHPPPCSHPSPTSGRSPPPRPRPSTGAARRSKTTRTTEPWCESYSPAATTRSTCCCRPRATSGPSIAAPAATWPSTAPACCRWRRLGPAAAASRSTPA